MIPSLLRLIGLQFDRYVHGCTLPTPHLFNVRCRPVLLQVVFLRDGLNVVNLLLDRPRLRPRRLSGRCFLPLFPGPVHAEPNNGYERDQGDERHNDSQDDGLRRLYRWSWSCAARRRREHKVGCCGDDGRSAARRD